MDKKYVDVQNLTEMAVSLYEKLWYLRGALIDVNEFELAERIEDPLRSFWFYTLFSDARTVFTIAGPQGVGKSLLANRMFDLSEEQGLLVDTKSCEHIPVVLKNVDENHPNIEEIRQNPVTLYKKPENKEEPRVFEAERMSYEEGRKRSQRPDKDDWIMMWHIINNPRLNMMSPVVVLPGLELGATWANSIRYIIDLSDALLYVLDSTRTAQDSAAEIEKWIKDAEVPVTPLCVVTKSHTMDKEKREEMKKTIEKQGPGYRTVFVESQDKVEGYKELFEAVDKMLHSASVSAPTKGDRFFRVLKRRVYDLVKEADKISREKEDNLVIDESKYITTITEELDKTWESMKDEILLEIEGVLARRGEIAKERGMKATKRVQGTIKRISLFLGGMSVEDFYKIEQAVKSAVFSGLDAEITRTVEKKLAQKSLQTNPGEYNWAEGALATVMITAPQQLSMQQMVKSFSDAGELSKAQTDLLSTWAQGGQQMLKEGGKMLKEYQNLQKEISQSKELAKGMSVLRGAKALKTGGNMGKASLATTTAAGGATQAGLEIFGKGVGGFSASALVGVISGAVAATAAISLTSMVIRTVRKMEWEIDRYVRTYVREAQDEISRRVEKNLDRFWDRFKRDMENQLREDLGLNRELRNGIQLREAIHQLQEQIKAYVKEGGF